MVVSSFSEVINEVVAKKLVGELLTIIDASYNDKTQREAVKSLVRQSCQKALFELNAQFQKTLLELTCQLEVKFERKEITSNG